MASGCCTSSDPGERNFGKSVLLQGITTHMARHSSFGMTIAPTCDSIKTFKETIPEAFVNRRDVEHKPAKKESEQGETHRRLFILCDDCPQRDKTPKGDLYKSAAMKDMLLNNRHDDMMCGTFAQHTAKRVGHNQ